MILTPGAYLKYRRCAAGLSIDDVAHVIDTIPAIPERGRAEWVALIEADAVPASWHTLVALRCVVPFDFGILERLTLIAGGEPIRAPRLCSLCASADFDTPGSDLCITCLSAVDAAATAA